MRPDSAQDCSRLRRYMNYLLTYLLILELPVNNHIGSGCMRMVALVRRSISCRFQRVCRKEMDVVVNKIRISALAEKSRDASPQ